MFDALDIPILQAPMVGASSPAMAAAVSNAGGLGNVACGAMTAEAIRTMVAETRALTARPFGINLFVVRRAPVDKAAVEHATRLLKPWREKFGLGAQPLLADWFADFDAQLEAVIALHPPLASFTFGCLTKEEVAKLHAAKIFVMGTATTVDEAQQWQSMGADAVCLQGSEAGGHRGSFTPEAQIAPVPIRQLMEDAKHAVSLPLVAAGGIMNGKDIAEMLKAGAAAVQLGTAFLLTPECVISQPWREVIKRRQGETRLTRAFSGRYARGIENQFMSDMAAVAQDLPAYPVQNVLTGDLRAACAKAGSSDCLSLWAGTRYAQAKELPAGEVLKMLWKETKDG